MTASTAIQTEWTFPIVYVLTSLLEMVTHKIQNISGSGHEGVCVLVDEA